MREGSAVDVHDNPPVEHDLTPLGGAYWKAMVQKT